MDLVDVLREAPRRVVRRGEELQARAKRHVESARARVRNVREDGRERLWRFEAATLDEAKRVIERAPEAPVLDTVKQQVRSLVDRRLGAVLAVPAGFADANVRDAVALVKAESDRVSLLAMRRHESAGKKRKMVLSALDAALV
jgi:hypothetical protein